MIPLKYDNSTYAIESRIMSGKSILQNSPLVADAYNLRYKITVDYEDSFMAVIDHKNYWVSRQAVTEGQTVTSIANRYGISESLLRKVNGMSKRDDFIPGQKIKVPIPMPDGNY